MTYGTTQADAVALAAKQPIGQQWIDGKNVIVTRWEARAHSWTISGQPIKWGIWPCWAYADMPDRQGFGGPFRALSDAHG